MPGTVVALKVSKGQQIKKGDPIMVIEAMKMENEISSDNSGTVVEIYVTKGAQVKTGDPLILIE
jgi:biotin carboxyl carrier protein